MDPNEILLNEDGAGQEGGSFSDAEFPATEASLGADVATRVEVAWKRSNQISSDPVVFRNVTPSDARQGALGDCWLISSIAAVAEFPGVINHMFVDQEINDEGKYRIRIYSPEESKFVTMTIDDQIPCRPRGGPAFAQSVEGEMWVPLLEKAYAKYVGSYEKLSGGWPALALEAMTGSKSALYSFKKDQQTATCLSFGDLTVKKAAELTGGASIRSNGEVHSFDEFWPKLKDFDEKKNLMTLASPGKDVYSESQGPSDDFGIVGGHAYTLIGVAEVEGFRLCNIRNPWGDFEWGGDWSDRSSLWDEHPGVKDALNPGLDKDDGEFWMSYDEMASTFTSVTVNFMNKDMASQPGPPPVDENGNPTWIEQMAVATKVADFLEDQLKDKMGVDVELDEYVGICAKKCCIIS